MRERERIIIEEAQPLIGLPIRTVQSMAARGEIPGAAKMRRRWTFDRAKLTSWVAHKEEETWQNAQKLHPEPVGEVIRSTRIFGFADSESKSPLKLVMQRLRDGESRRSENEPSAKSTATRKSRSQRPSLTGGTRSPGQSPRER
jgi:hypothetical protein